MAKVILLFMKKSQITKFQLAHPCNEMLYDCFWNTKPKNCGDIFTLEKTTSGYCCSFNYKGAKTHQLYITHYQTPKLVVKFQNKF